MNLFVLCASFLLLAAEGLKNDEVVLSRRKRYVAFPDGSSLVFAFCNTAAVITPFQIFTEGVNWGISYDLPNGTTFLESKKYLKGRRQRRELYTSIETLIDSMGFDGKACIYKTLCEAPRVLANEDASLAEKLLHILFKYPQEPISDQEPEEHTAYRWAYGLGRSKKDVDEQQDCSKMFPTCSISLIDLALGYYHRQSSN